MTDLVPIERIERHIYLIRGHKVMIDTDLADLYDVPTYRLNEAVKRNRQRFPSDFMFQLTKGEADSLTSQIAILKKQGRGTHRKYLPYVFTEQGVSMLSSVLNSERAISVNIAIMRAFVRLREIMATHIDLARKLMIWKRSFRSMMLNSWLSLMPSASLSALRARPQRRLDFALESALAQLTFC